MRRASRSAIPKRARSSTACPMTNGARSTRRKRAPSRRPLSPRRSRSIEWRRSRYGAASDFYFFNRGDWMPDIGGIAGERLRSFIERIERLEEEKRALSGDIKEVFAEAKGNGFDTKIMRQLIRIRRMDKDDLDEQETLLDVYKRALGMLPEQPASAAAD